ncbi:MAG: hypothetical protein PHO02_05890 [Candidatus Nanoarchaeia archaeon]|nr:hypothetical protein [Candidatus Nanoarchaeia archaeon]
MEPEQTKDEASVKEAAKLKKQMRIAKALCIGGLGIAVFGIGTCMQMNDRLVNRTHISTDSDSTYASETRSDGLFGLLGSTEYVSFTGKSGYMCEEVNVFRPFGQTAFYEDCDHRGKHDGLVDRIFLPDGDKSIVLYRSRDYAGNEERFNEGDRILKETKERFSVANGVFF